jgi:hypothetical protein
MEEKNVETEIYQEYEDECAYAKLQGPNLLKFIKKKIVYIGRETPIVDFQQDEEVIFISDSNKISRKHLKIFWDGTKCEWYVKNLSKNPVIVNKKFFKNSDNPTQISPVSAIKIDTLEFYFIQARDDDINAI